MESHLFLKIADCQLFVCLKKKETLPNLSFRIGFNYPTYWHNIHIFEPIESFYLVSIATSCCFLRILPWSSRASLHQSHLWMAFLLFSLHIVCPEAVDPLYIILGIVIGIIIIGLILLLIWRLLTYIHDKREFSRFEKERQNAKWEQVRNPCMLCAINIFVRKWYEKFTWHLFDLYSRMLCLWVWKWWDCIQSLPKHWSLCIIAMTSHFQVMVQ